MSNNANNSTTTDAARRQQDPQFISAGNSGAKGNIGTPVALPGAATFDTQPHAGMSFFNQSGVDNTRRGGVPGDADMSAMDDVQFSASLDALLNGDQNAMRAAAQQNNTNGNGSSNNANLGPGRSPTGPMGVSGGIPHQQHQQQHNLGNVNSQFLVGAPGNGNNNVSVVNNSNGQQMVPQGMYQQQGVGLPVSQQQQSQQQHQPQLQGLPLASANQGALHLAPQGPHSAAQMSLSAGHAAATGAFHPGNCQVPAQQPQQQQQPPQPAPPQAQQQAPFSWPIGSNGVPNMISNMPQPHHQHHHHHHAMSNTGTESTSGMSAITNPSGMSSGNTHVSSAGLKSSAPASRSKSSGTGNPSSGTKRRRSSGSKAADISVSAISEDEGEREKRRQDRNMREQQRSHRITEQIAHLKDVLSSANLQFKPDKYSTLTTTVDYIKQLQEKSKVLDAEHRKLLDTITETNEIVNNQYVPAYTSGSDAPSISNDLLADGSPSSLEDESMVFVRGIDYKIAFNGCGIPLALASIDGRFLDCNDTFLELTGYSREELLPIEKQSGGQQTTTNVSFSPAQEDDKKKNLSMFNLLSRDGMEQVFVAMSEMLKQPGSIGTTQKRSDPSSKVADFWSGPVKLSGQEDMPVKLNVTLVRTNRGRPKFFNCALTALNGEDMRYDDQTTITTPSQAPSASDTTASGGENQTLPPPKPLSDVVKKQKTG